MNSIERKLIEKHMEQTKRLRYSKATIVSKSYSKQYSVVIVGFTSELENLKTLKEEHLMLFELEVNKDEL